MNRSAGKWLWVWEIPEIRSELASPQIKTDYKWYEHPSFNGFNFKEGIERVQFETDNFLEKLGYKHLREKGYYDPIAPTEEQVVLFAHAGFGSLFLSSVLDIPYPQIATQFPMSHYTGITQITFDVKVRNSFL